MSARTTSPAEAPAAVAATAETPTAATATAEADLIDQQTTEIAKLTLKLKEAKNKKNLYKWAWKLDEKMIDVLLDVIVSKDEELEERKASTKKVLTKFKQSGGELLAFVEQTMQNDGVMVDGNDDDTEGDKSAGDGEEAKPGKLINGEWVEGAQDDDGSGPDEAAEAEDEAEEKDDE